MEYNKSVRAPLGDDEIPMAWPKAAAAEGSAALPVKQAVHPVLAQAGFDEPALERAGLIAAHLQDAGLSADEAAVAAGSVVKRMGVVGDDYTAQMVEDGFSQAMKEAGFQRVPHKPTRWERKPSTVRPVMTEAEVVKGKKTVDEGRSAPLTVVDSGLQKTAPAKRNKPLIEREDWYQAKARVLAKFQARIKAKRDAAMGKLSSAAKHPIQQKAEEEMREVVRRMNLLEQLIDNQYGALFDDVLLKDMGGGGGLYAQPTALDAQGRATAVALVIDLDTFMEAGSKTQTGIERTLNEEFEHQGDLKVSTAEEARSLARAIHAANPGVFNEAWQRYYAFDISQGTQPAKPPAELDDQQAYMLYFEASRMIRQGKFTTENTDISKDLPAMRKAWLYLSRWVNWLQWQMNQLPKDLRETWSWKLEQARSVLKNIEKAALAAEKAALDDVEPPAQAAKKPAAGDESLDDDLDAAWEAEQKARRKAPTFTPAQQALRGLRSLPDPDNGQVNILSRIAMEGGIAIYSDKVRKLRKQQGLPTGGELDWLERADIPPFWKGIVFRRGNQQNVDTIVGQLFDEGYFPEAAEQGDVTGEMLAAKIQDVLARYTAQKKGQADVADADEQYGAEMSKLERQRVEFERSTAAGPLKVRPADLKPGDVMQVKGDDGKLHPVEVMRLETRPLEAGEDYDPQGNPGHRMGPDGPEVIESVTLKDGTTFGVQTIDGQEGLYVDEFSVKDGADFDERLREAVMSRKLDDADALLHFMDHYGLGAEMPLGEIVRQVQTRLKLPMKKAQQMLAAVFDTSPQGDGRAELDTANPLGAARKRDRGPSMFGEDFDLMTGDKANKGLFEAPSFKSQVSSSKTETKPAVTEPITQTPPNAVDSGAAPMSQSAAAATITKDQAAEVLKDSALNDRPIRTYEQAVAANQIHMGTQIRQWSAFPFTGEVRDGRPIQDLAGGPNFQKAPTLFPSSGSVGHGNCEWCGKQPVKNFYHIKHDGKGWTLAVGSECIGHFADMSGDSMAGAARQSLALTTIEGLNDARRTLSKEFSEVQPAGYGRTERVWRNLTARSMADEVPDILGKITLESGPAAHSRWLNTKLEAAREWMSRYDELMARPATKKHQIDWRTRRIIHLESDLKHRRELPDYERDRLQRQVEELRAEKSALEATETPTVPPSPSPQVPARGASPSDAGGAPSFSLESTTPAQLDAEARRKELREKLRARQDKPLIGTQGDIGQMQMFGGGDLFAQPGKAEGGERRAESDTRIRDDSPEAKPILAEIDAITARGQQRLEAMASPDLRALTHASDLLTPEEKARLHELKMQLRSKSAQEAKEDIQKRREARKPAAAASAPQGLTDFGEKIGGARKDTAVKGEKVPKAATPASESQDPGWRKRYDAVEIVSGKDKGRWSLIDLRKKDWTGAPQHATRTTFASEAEARQHIPLIAVARNHGVYSVGTAEGGSPSSEALKKSIEDQMKQINALKMGHERLLLATGITERFKKALADGQLTAEKYAAHVREGTILSDVDYAQGKAIQEQIRTLQNTPTPEMQAADAAKRYGIFRNVTDRKRVRVVDETFASYEDGMRYLAKHAEDIIEVKTSFGEEILAKPENAVRVGPERRQRPADAALFQEAFGFRGVEFGNWMRDGGTESERQEVLNHAYDGLMDLAETLGIPPRAISLNGELSLAFGARGHGLTGAKAHYERDYAVINLTKMAGAGSLAHEWFHALDHYLGRQDGKAARERKVNAEGNLAFPMKGREGDYVSHGFRFNSDVRAELRARYKELMERLFTKAEQFVEDTEKAEKFVAAARQWVVDQLAAIRKDLADAKDPQYYKRNNKPATQEQLDAFDTHSARILEGEALTTEWRYNQAGDKPASARGAMTGRWSNDTLDAMNEIVKSVRGRSGFNKEGHGALDQLRGVMKRYAERLKMLADATAQTTKSKMVPTSYAMDAKRIDQGRASEYWATPHEMAARAFSAYVEDKLQEQGRASEFLAYGSDNNLPQYRLFKVRPFPAGEERKQINGLFDQFFGELKVKETEQGLMLHSARKREVSSSKSQVPSSEKPETLNLKPETVDAAGWNMVDTDVESSGNAAAEMLRFEDVPDADLSDKQRDNLRALEAIWRQDAGAGGTAAALTYRRVSAPADARGRSLVQFARHFEDATGKKIEWVDSDPALPLPWRAAVSPQRSNTIFVHARAPGNVLALIGHEWGHTLEYQNKPLYRALQAQLAAYVTRKDYRNARAGLKDRYRRAILRTELTNNVIGDFFTDAAFWREVERQDRGLLRQALQSVMDWFHDMAAKLGSLWGTEQVLTDVAAARQAVAAAFAEAVRQGPYSELAASEDADMVKTIDQAAHEAATSPQNDLPEPTPAQKEAGNYQKGHVRIAGHDISIENPAGSKRKPEWPALKDHYGYFKGTNAKDGDHVDVFVKPGTPEDYAGPVHVVRQNVVERSAGTPARQAADKSVRAPVLTKTGVFDEYKVMLGYPTAEEAREAYLRNYEPGWPGLHKLTTHSQAEFQKIKDTLFTVPADRVPGVRMSDQALASGIKRQGEEETRRQGDSDAEYLAAVEAGDLEKAQRMVDAAATAAGYSVGPVFHGAQSLENFDKFEPRYGFMRYHYFASNPAYAKAMAKRPGGDYSGGTPRVLKAFLHLNNPYDLQAADSLAAVMKKLRDEFGSDLPAKVLSQFPLRREHEWAQPFALFLHDVAKDGAAFVNPVRQLLMNRGYDGVIFNEIGPTFDNEVKKHKTTTFVVFEPSQIKSADAVTRDESGNVIPLSQRFNPDSDSILYSAAKRGPVEKVANAVFTKAPVAMGSGIAKAGAAVVEKAGLQQVLAKLGSNNLDKFISNVVFGKVAKWAHVDSAKKAVEVWLGKPGALSRLAKGALDQTVPLWNVPREWLAAYHESQRKAAWGREKAMDVIRALSHNAKVSDLAYPQEFVEDPAWRVKLFDAMEGKADMTALPQPLQDLAERLRKLLRETGQELVRQGIMSLDTFEELSATGWMPRYTEDEAEAAGGSWLKAFKLGVKDLVAQRSTAWHVVDTTRKEKDGQYAIVSRDEAGKRNRWRFRNEQHRNAWYEDFIKGEAVTMLTKGGKEVTSLLAALDNDATRAVREEIKTLTREKIDRPAELSENLRNVVRRAVELQRFRYKKEAPFEPDKLIKDPVYAVARYVMGATHNAATMELLKQTAKQPEWVSDVALAGYTQMPDNDRFGPLAGKHVKDEIARQILDLVDVPGTVLGMYDAILRTWKAGKLVLNPGSHIRDAVGNVAFSVLAGTNPLNPGNLPYYRDAIAALRDGGDAYAELIEMQVLGGDAFTTEVKTALKGLLPDTKTLEKQDAGQIMRLIMGVGGAARGIYEWAAAVRQVPDNLYKTAAYLKFKAQGMSPAEAADEVRKWFPYYDRLGSSGLIKQGSRFVMPFSSFFRESTRILGRGAVERPLALASILSFPYLVTQLSLMMLGLGDEDEESVFRSMRGKLKLGLSGNAPVFSMLLPTRTDEGQLQQWDISSVLPFADLLGTRVEMRQGEDEWTKFWRGLFTQSPILSTAWAWSTNTDAFSGRRIVEDDMGVLESTKERLRELGDTMLPPLTPWFGVHAATLANAGRRMSNLETRNATQSYLRALVGLDVRSADPNLRTETEHFRKEKKLPLANDGSLYATPLKSRLGREIKGELIQDAPDIDTVADALLRLEESGNPIKTREDMEKLLKGLDPDRLIKEEYRRKLVQSFSPEALRVWRNQQSEFKAAQRRLPSVMKEASPLVKARRARVSTPVTQ